MKTIKIALLGILGLACFLPASAYPGERVDFFGTVLGYQGNAMVVQQQETGAQWQVFLQQQYRQQGQRHRRWESNNSFQPGQPIHITGTQTGWSQIQADPLSSY